MALAPLPVSEMVPVPATVSPLVLSICMVPAALVVVIMPELVSMLLLTFMVRLSVIATVTLPLTLVPADDVLVVTGPPERFKVVELEPLPLANVSA